MLVLVIWLAACSQAPMQSASPPPSPEATSQRPGLGTAWGETVQSTTHDVDFKRANENTPDDMAAIYYNDVLKTSSGATRASLPMVSGAIRLEFRDGSNNTLKLTRGDNGRWNIVGKSGDRYEMALRNEGTAAYEVVASVDGLDVISGRPGSYGNRGYILRPGKTLIIDGFRKNSKEVAAFRFSSVARSYAANTPSGDTANVGVIGIALFVEKDADEAIRTKANPFPGSDSKYAPPPIPAP
jgi:hypothetical protein